MAVLMLRHTTPDVAPGICYGQLDLDVADTFQAEATSVLERLPSISRIHSSPLQRCRKLAQFIASELAVEFKTDRRLQEMDFGRWEGQSWDKIPRAELDAWAADFYQARPHGGESVADLKTRVDDMIRSIPTQNEGTLLVTHAGFIRAALAEGPEAEQFQTDIPYGGLVRLPHSKEAPR